MTEDQKDKNVGVEMFAKLLVLFAVVAGIIIFYLIFIGTSYLSFNERMVILVVTGIFIYCVIEKCVDVPTSDDVPGHDAPCRYDSCDDRKDVLVVVRLADHPKDTPCVFGNDKQVSLSMAMVLPSNGEQIAITDSTNSSIDYITGTVMKVMKTTGGIGENEDDYLIDVVVDSMEEINKLEESFGWEVVEK
jgi:hypothetical protein